MQRRLGSAPFWLAAVALPQPAAAATLAGLSSLTIGALSGALIFGGALLGMALGRILPAPHLSEPSRDSIKLGAGMVSLMAALVLGLLVSAAKDNFDTANAALTQTGARVILLDRVLAHYGAETEALRRELRAGVADTIEMLWPEDRPTASGLSAFEHSSRMERMLDEIRALTPRTDSQRALHAQAQQLANEILLARWVHIEQAQTSLPPSFLQILLFWLTMLYASFGLIAQRNATVVVVLLVGALSLATAIALILEMNDPLGGLVKVSSGPMRKALEYLGE